MNTEEIPNKILAYIDQPENIVGGQYVNRDDLKSFIEYLVNPPKKMVWHMRTKDIQEWRPVSDEDYQAGQHLARFEFQQFEL